MAQLSRRMLSSQDVDRYWNHMNVVELTERIAKVKCMLLDLSLVLRLWASGPEQTRYS